MPFSKILGATLLILASFNAAAQQPPIGDNEQAKQYKEQLIKSGYLENFTPEAVEQQTEKYKEISNEIAQKSISQLPVSLTKYYGVDEQDAQAFAPSTSSELPNELVGIFVSFSMTDHEIREAFKEASEQGGELYFNGMHPDDKSIMDTIKRIKAITADREITATARFHPKAFTEFSIQSVPAILYATKGKIGLIHGLLNMAHLKEKLEHETGFNDYGFLGPTKPVIEKNLIDEIASRVANIDGEKLKKQAVDNFWKKQSFISLPDAKQDEEFFINPTVKVTKDIVNPRGEVLARAGQVLNPLATLASKNIYILFNAKNNAHIEWLHSYLNSIEPNATVMIMTSQLDSNRGWEHLAVLRQHFGREIYIIPKELVDRFKITALPAVVSTDNEKQLLRINQIQVPKKG
jgi:conjugal transfer pilus assembly protein TraW